MDVTINYTIKQIADITKGKSIQHNTLNDPAHLLLDSRKLIFPGKTIFFAVATPHRNGIEFIEELYKKGVQNFVIDQPDFTIDSFEKANFIVVENTINALQALAAHHRNKFHFPVIGITGSNGKTIVKEWLNLLLNMDFSIVRSPKSYNSQIGAALSVLQMNEQNTLGIFEAGISMPGEMEKLEKIIHPQLGIITNIGEAHSEGFENNLQKAQEKLKLFTHSAVLIFCSDYDEINSAASELKNKNDEIRFFIWSRKKDASLKIISVEKTKNISAIKAVFKNKELHITVPFIDEASIENAITCWCVLLYLNIDEQKIAERMQQIHPVEMRLELKEGINNCSIINDSYSSDINSLKIALDFLHQQKQHQNQTVILSDILQSGKDENELYAEVASLLKQKNIEKLIAIGPAISRQHQQFDLLKEKYFFTSVEEFKKHFYIIHFSDETILLKGARVFEFEQISRLLEQKVHQTILSIDLNAIAHNLKQYRQLLNPGVKIMAVVKAFSYGSGSYEIANLLQFNKVDYLAVAYADEGVELRKAGITMPVMVMNPEENSFNTLVQYNLEPEIFSIALLFSFKKYLQSSAIKNYPIHIKLDTGMHRLGIEKDDMDIFIEALQEDTSIKVQSIFSHLVASEDEKEDAFTQQQAKIFLECCKKLENALGYFFLKHIANTSGASRHKDLQLDMIRTGIGLYGIDANEKMQRQLKNVSTLTTTISQIKKVKAGKTVGYGRKAVLQKDSVIATVRIGYADGYPRMLSNGIGKMLVSNTLVPVVGNVCMDMTMLDVTGVTNINEGDPVIVFGEQLPLQKIAEWCNTIPYEIMTGISQRVKRIYFEE